MTYSRRQLYALGEPLGDAVTRKVGGKVVYGGGGGGGPSSQTITQSNIPDWLRPQAETVLGGAMQELFNVKKGEDGIYDVTGVKPYVPYSANPEDYVAGFSPLQQQAMGSAAGLQMPGQFGAATNMSGMAGMGGLGTAGLAQGYAGQQAGAGADYAQMATDPSAMQAYMSPYMQNVVDVQQQAAQRQADIARQTSQAQFARAGAFGGARHNIQQAQAAADLARQKQGIQAAGLQQAFGEAQKAQQFGANLGLQGLAGAQQGLQTSLGGYGLLGQQAGVMGGLGAQQLESQRNIIGTQAQMGGLEQQRQQSIINQAISDYAQAQQYPLQQFNAYNALLRGYAVPGQTATTYQAAPGLAQQVAGLGLGAAGVSQLVKKKGGTVKSMAEGGFAAIDDKVRNNPTKYSEDQIKRSTANEIIDPQTAAIALAEIARAKKAAAGLNALSSGLPAQGFAPGGIVAFEDGGKVERYQNAGLVQPTPLSIPWSQYADTVQRNELQNTLRQLYRRYASDDPYATAFLSATPEQRKTAKTLLEQLPTMSLDQLKYLQSEGLGMLKSAPGQQMYGQELGEPMRPAELAAAGVTPVAGAGAGAGTAPSTSPAPRQAPPSTAPSNLENILDQVRLAQERARSPAEIMNMVGYDPTQQGVDVQKGLAALAAPNLTELTPEAVRQMRKAAMPQGKEAYESELTPEYAAMREASEKAAKEQLEERQSISERLDKMRASQEARYKAKEKDLETDRSRSVGIALLEAAQAMTQPGQTFMQGLTRSAAAGGKRLMADKERLDQRSDALTDALARLDESRLGDAKERAAAKNEYNQAMLGARKSMLDHMQSNLGITRSEAATTLDTILKRQGDRATLAQRTAEAQQQYLLGAERNRLAGMGVGIQALTAADAGRKAAGEGVTDAIRAQATLDAANKDPGELALLRAVTNDPKLLQTAVLMRAKEGKQISEQFIEYLKALGPTAATMPPEQVVAQFYKQLAALRGPANITASSTPTGPVLK
jgi:hypothetical protein